MRTRPPTATTLATLLLAGSLLAGCSDAEPGSADVPGQPSTSSAAPSTPSTPSMPTEDGSAGPLARIEQGRFASYVALGDSFTAAPLAGPTDNAEGCLRSQRNYPAQLARVLDADLTDRSCTGADTASLVGVQRVLQGGAVPPQFDALRPDTSLVTIGIGGNDFAIFSTLVGTCVEAAGEDRAGSPCRAAIGRDGVAELREDIRTVGDRLVAVVEGVRDRAPEAEVVVVGYPEIVPDDATCPQLLPLAEGDYPFAARLNELLADVQQRAARRAGAGYVDLYRASDGHDVCSGDPWINGRVTSEATALAYHPLAAGQEAVAGLVLAELAERAGDARNPGDD